MKEQAIAIHHSGYPLMIAESSQTPIQEKVLKVVSTINDSTTSVEKNNITNDPQNWDLTWFNNYE